MNGKDKVIDFKRKLSGFSRVSLDTSCFVYQFEKNTVYFEVTNVIFEMIEAGKIEGITSVIAVLEYFIKPEKDRNYELIRNYEQVFLNFPNLNIWEINWDTVRLASKIRANYPFKTADSIQLASTIQGKADAFITNDRNLKSFKEVKVLVLRDFVRK